MDGKTTCDIKASPGNAQYRDGQALHTVDSGKLLLVEPCGISLYNITRHTVANLGQSRLQHAGVMAVVRILRQKSKDRQTAVFGDDISSGTHLSSNRSRYSNSV